MPEPGVEEACTLCFAVGELHEVEEPVIVGGKITLLLIYDVCMRCWLLHGGGDRAGLGQD